MAGRHYLHIRPCRPSPTERGRRRQGREEVVSGVAREREAARGQEEHRFWAPPCPPGVPPTQALPRSPAHLGIGQHDVLDARRPAGLSALHAHVVDLVAADLAVLLAGDRQLPGDVHSSGVQWLYLYLPWWPTRHWGPGDKEVRWYVSWVRWI